VERFDHSTCDMADSAAQGSLPAGGIRKMRVPRLSLRDAESMRDPKARYE
jgi:hypothetical protein